MGHKVVVQRRTATDILKGVLLIIKACKRVQKFLGRTNFHGYAHKNGRDRVQLLQEEVESTVTFTCAVLCCLQVWYGTNVNNVPCHSINNSQGRYGKVVLKVYFLD